MRWAPSSLLDFRSSVPTPECSVLLRIMLFRLWTNINMKANGQHFWYGVVWWWGDMGVSIWFRISPVNLRLEIQLQLSHIKHAYDKKSLGNFWRGSSISNIFPFLTCKILQSWESLSEKLLSFSTHHCLEIAVIAIFIVLFFSNDCSQATIQMCFYDILIPRLTYAQYYCQHSWFSEQTSHVGWIKLVM